jgi:hypothetical protein
MAHIEIINGKETMVTSKNVKICMKLEDPEEALQVIKDTKKKHPLGSESSSKEQQMSNNNATDYFQLGYNTYPKPGEPTDDLKSCLTNEEYIKSHEQWMDGYQKAVTEDNQAENNFYDDAKL